MAFGILGAFGAALLLTTLAALKAMRAEEAFDFVAKLLALATPASAGGWVELAGVVTFGAAMGLFAAAVQAARHGAGAELAARAAEEP